MHRPAAFLYCSGTRAEAVQLLVRIDPRAAAAIARTATPEREGVRTR
jgi:hypothetical protein